MAKILIFEDDEFLADAYRIQFKKKHKVKVLIPEKNYIEQVSKFDPNLILLDIMLPESDGLDVLENLKAHQDTKTIPIVMLSNIDDPTTIKKAKKIGADDYIVKINISISELEDKLSPYFSQKYQKKNYSIDAVSA